MDFLPIGSVVRLKKTKDDTWAMITARTALYKKSNGEIGYLDYAGCLYPEGQIDNELVFFNTEDIDEVLFKGYIDDEEKQLVIKINNALPTVEYPHFSIKEVEN